MGALAGFYGGWLDALLSRIGDIFFAIPYILAAVVVMTVFSDYRSVPTLAFAIGGFAWASTARVVARSPRVRQADFVMASQALGQSKFRILLSHVIPNAIAPLLVVSTLGLAASIVAEATLSFLGVGLGSDVMSWGNDISQAQSLSESRRWRSSIRRSRSPCGARVRDPGRTHRETPSTRRRGHVDERSCNSHRSLC
jgi:oligopeptide transport system permease protein